MTTLDNYTQTEKNMSHLCVPDWSSPVQIVLDQIGRCTREHHT